MRAFGERKLVIHTDNRLSGRKEDTVSGYTLAGMLALLEAVLLYSVIRVIL